MWNISPNKINQSLSSAQSTMIRNGEGFVVVLVADLTPADHGNMVKIN
jgi:hypothetical protein